MSQRLTSIIVRIVGPAPPPTAERSVKRRYTRRVYLKILPPQVIVYSLVVIVGAPTWLLVILAAGPAAWLYGFVLLSLQMRRE